MRPEVTSFFDAPTNTYSYVVRDPATTACAIIDSVLAYDPASGTTSSKNADLIVQFIEQQGLQVAWILETHAHADHLSAAVYLQQKLGGKIAIGAHIGQVQQVFSKAFHIEPAVTTEVFDHLWQDGEQFQIGELQATVIDTPGHTPACVSYLIGDAVFVGDTLFMPDYGTARCDFPGGDAHQLYQSVQKLYQLPDETRVFLCHDYLPQQGRTTYGCETSIAEQRAHNIHLNKQTTEAEFVHLRHERDKTLQMPKLILPSIQVNIRAGHFPEAESNGVQYLKIPLNYFKRA